MKGAIKFYLNTPNPSSTTSVMYICLPSKSRVLIFHPLSASCYPSNWEAILLCHDTIVSGIITSLCNCLNLFMPWHRCKHLFKKKELYCKLVPQNVQAITLSLTIKNGCKNLFCASSMTFQTLREETVNRDFHSSIFQFTLQWNGCI